MYRNEYVKDFLTIFYSLGPKPLENWSQKMKDGYVRRVRDNDIKSMTLEMASTNVISTYITSPRNPRDSLGIRLPYMVMIVKNLKRYFTFEVVVRDHTNQRRRFRISNYRTCTTVHEFSATVPIGLRAGWNKIQLNLCDFTRRAYGTAYEETVRVQIHANIRLRRVYFSNRLYRDDELPEGFRLSGYETDDDRVGHDPIDDEFWRLSQSNRPHNRGFIKNSIVAKGRTSMSLNAAQLIQMNYLQFETPIGSLISHIYDAPIENAKTKLENLVTIGAAGDGHTQPVMHEDHASQKASTNLDEEQKVCESEL